MYQSMKTLGSLSYKKLDETMIKKIDIKQIYTFIYIVAAKQKVNHHEDA